MKVMATLKNTTRFNFTLTSELISQLYHTIWKNIQNSLLSVWTKKKFTKYETKCQNGCKQHLVVTLFYFRLHSPAFTLIEVFTNKFFLFAEFIWDSLSYAVGIINCSSWIILFTIEFILSCKRFQNILLNQQS